MFESFYNNYGWTYNQAFGWMFAGQAMVSGSIALALALTFFFIGKMIKKSHEKQKVHPEYAQMEDNEAVDVSSFHKNAETQEGKTKSKNTKHVSIVIFEVLTIIASWYALLAFAIFPSVLSGLYIIPLWAAMLITFSVFLVKFITMVYAYSPNFLNKQDNNQKQVWCSKICKRVGVTLSRNKLPFCVFLTFALGYTIFVPLMTMDTCLDFFNYGYGEKFLDFGLSTRFSRYLQIPTACPQGTACQIYATLAEDASTSTILNVHTGVDITTVTVGYDIKKKLDMDKINAGVRQTLNKTVTAKSFYIGLETKGDRYVHSALLFGMEPNTEYYFEVYHDNKVLENGTYQTLPTDKLERNLLIAAGGDAGNSIQTQKMTLALGNFSLDAIIIGGDVAYDNGIRSCYYSFDLFFNMFKPVNQKIGKLVPFITSIGNHDIGFNAFQDGQVDITQNLYYIYFPMHSKSVNGKPSNEVPDLEERLPYNYHLLGNTIQVCLDSAYMFKYDGVQLDFLKNVSASFPDQIKMANFHVPMYPTCFNPLYDDPRTLEHPRKYWAPVFEDYKYASVFENHVHLYKASSPLKNGTISNSTGNVGVMYFGDGNWGINPDVCYPTEANGNKTGILDAYNDTTHVWLINITNETMSHWAVNISGEMFDKYYNLTVSNYINKKTLDDEL